MQSKRQPLYVSGKLKIGDLLESERREIFAGVRAVSGARRVAVWLLLQCDAQGAQYHDSIALADAFFHLFSASDDTHISLASSIRASIACGIDARSVLKDKHVSLDRVPDAAVLVAWAVSNTTSTNAAPFSRVNLFPIDQLTTTINNSECGATWDATRAMISNAEPPCCEHLSGRNAAELFQSMLIASREHGVPMGTEINSPLPPMRNDTLRNTVKESNAVFNSLLTSKEVVRDTGRHGDICETLVETDQLFRITPRCSIAALVQPRLGIGSDVDSETNHATCATTTMDAWPAFLLCDAKHKSKAQLYCKSPYPGLVPPVSTDEDALNLHLAWGRVRPVDVSLFTSTYAPAETTTYGAPNRAEMSTVLGRFEMTLLPLANAQLFEFCYMQPMKGTLCFEHSEDPGAFARPMRQLRQFVHEVTTAVSTQSTTLDHLQREFSISPYGTSRVDNYPCTLTFDGRLRAMRSNISTQSADLGLSNMVTPMFRTPFPAMTVGDACTAALHSANRSNRPISSDGTYTLMLELMRMQGASASLSEAMLNLAKYASAMREVGIQPHTAAQRLRAVSKDVIPTKRARTDDSTLA